MEAGYGQWQEKHHQDLTVDGAFDLPVTHANIPHDLIALLVIIALGDLFVVHDERRRHGKQRPQEDAQEQEAAVAGIKVLGGVPAAVQIIVVHISFNISLVIIHRAGLVYDVVKGVPAGFQLLIAALQIKADADGLPGGNAAFRHRKGGHQSLQRRTVRHHQVGLHRVGMLQGPQVRRPVQPHRQVKLLPQKGQMVFHLRLCNASKPDRSLTLPQPQRFSGERLMLLLVRTDEPVNRGSLCIRPGNLGGHLQIARRLEVCDLAAGSGRCIQKLAGQRLLVHNAVAVFFRIDSQHIRVLIPQRVLGAHVQGNGGGKRHQNHGGQDTDVSQTDGILLHAEQHTGYQGEMLCLVIIDFVLSQKLQQHDAAGGKQTVGPDDDQNHRQKKQRNRAHGVFCGDGQIVASAHAHSAHKRHQQLGAGLPLPHVYAVQQLDGLCQVHGTEIVQQDQDKDAAEQEQRCACGRRRKFKLQGHRAVDEPQ